MIAVAATRTVTVIHCRAVQLSDACEVPPIAQQAMYATDSHATCACACACVMLGGRGRHQFDYLAAGAEDARLGVRLQRAGKHFLQHHVSPAQQSTAQHSRYK